MLQDILTDSRLILFLLDPEANPEFVKEVQSADKRNGVFVYPSVDDVDATYEDVLALGHKLASEPRDWSWRNRGFV